MPFRVTFFVAHAIICIIMVYLEKEEQILEFLHLNATFGRLEQHELHLHSGLNLICAPNESGKSTWGSFICAMLYGLSTRDRGLMADKNRFAPWSGAAMQGRMDILSDGRALTLQRDTRRANAPMGNFSCTYTGTGTPVEGITAQNAGEQLLGVPRDVWERSAFIGQNALAVSQSAELERRISSLITTGEEDASFTESYERLKKQLNRRKHNKTGQIPVLERDIAQLHQSLQELDALEQQARQAQEEVSALTQRVDGLRHQAAQQQAQIRQERINAWHRAARTAEEAQRRADILAEAAAPLPDDAALSLLEGQAAALQSDMAALTGQRSAANEARTAAAEAHAVWEAHPLYPDDAAALERRAASIVPAKAPSLLLPAADGLLLAICAVLAVVFRAASPQRWIFAGMALLAAALTVFSVCLRRRAIRQEQERVDRDRAALAEQTASYLPLRDRAAQTDEAARRAGAILSGAEENCRSRLLTLLTQVQRFAPAAADLSGAQIALSDARRSRDTLADARRTAREAAVGRDALQSQLSEEDLTRPPMPVIPIAGGSVELELSQAQTALADARSRYDHLLGRIRGLDRSSDLTDQLSQKREELARLQQEYDAITLAMTALEQANIILKNRFSPALGARAAEIFSALTDGRYDKVLLSQDMALSAEQSGDPMSRSIRLLSQGAADQLYLAVRLAICGMVLPEEKHVPLLLDDALVSFDDRRLHAALDVLLTESKQRQILLFTCQTRERDYLAGHKNVTVLTL
mgnify:FL=1